MQIRIIYRLVEFSDGFDTTLTRHEAFFYCLDSVPMFFGFGLFNIYHPGRVLVGPGSSFRTAIGARTRARISDSAEIIRRDDSRT